jgi:hypothetical protein
MQRLLLILSVLVFCSQCGSPSLAQGTSQSEGSVRVPVPMAPNEIYPPGTQKIFEWIYACSDSAGAGCRLDCAAGQREAVVSVNHASHVQMYLIGLSIGRNVLQSIFVFYTFREDGNDKQGSAFILTPNSCNVQGMKLTYSGLPK